MSKLTIYGDMLSQPTRAVLLFCKLTKIPYDFMPVHINKGEHFKDEFKKINPLSYVPAIKLVDSNKKEFTLSESHAIIRFLSVYYLVEEKWYPRQNLYRKALIDQYLDYHHLNTRFVFSNKFFKTFFGPILEKKGKKVRGYDVDERLPLILTHFDTLLGKQKYIVDNIISVADLLFTCEANQLNLIRYDLSKYTNLENYLKSMNDLADMKEVNVVLDKLKIKIYSEESPQAKF